jgi:hypothetical protein
MSSGTTPIVAGALVAAGIGALMALDPDMSSVIVMVLLGGILFTAIGWKMRTENDATWLPKWVLIGFAAKIMGTLGRHYMVTVLYRAEASDSFQYYQAAIEFVVQFQSGRPLALSGRGSLATQITEAIAGGLFIGYMPDLLGGFIMFATIAYCGQLFLYAAFRRWAQPHQLKLYAALVLLLPTFAFWPSSIGKDALVIFALGGSAYFIARMLQTFQVRWVFGLAPFLALLGLIRIHVVALVVAALIGTLLLARQPKESDAQMKARRLTTLTVSLAAGALAYLLFPDLFGVDISSIEEADNFASEVVRRTTERGTIAAGGPVSGPEDVPGAIALVLFRPFVFEANEIQHFFAAAETTLLLGVTIWQVPTILRNWRQWRSNAYVVFASIYVLAYAIAFSVVRNLGIIARQRGQVLGFFLVIVIGMGMVSIDRPRTDPHATAAGTVAERE